MAKIIGKVCTEWLKNTGDDRFMKLLEDFAFEDNNGVLWTAKAGDIVDGASIPRFLWGFYGDPFVGDYRRASVIHDVYCKDQAKPHQSVHQMFYELMLADGVNPSRAKHMAFAVRTWGPKWETVES